MNIKPDPREARYRYPPEGGWPKHRRSSACVQKVNLAIADDKNNLPSVQIFTDGSCSPNPGPGGWAALLCFAGSERGEFVEQEVSGFDPITTNNRMEMMAAIGALEVLTEPSIITISTDSQLLRFCAMGRWKRKKNKDLWRRLDLAAAPHRITWKWIKGHNGHPENERVDRLASVARLNQ